ADSRERLPPPTLLLDDGRRSRRVSALLGTDDASPLAGPDPPPWRAAFSVPAELLTDSHLAFALETDRGIVDLPRPQEAATRTRKAPAPVLSIDPSVLREERRRREAAELAADDRRQAMALLEQRLQSERRLRSASEQAAREARDELGRLRAQWETAKRGGEREMRELADRVAFLEEAR